MALETESPEATEAPVLPSLDGPEAAPAVTEGLEGAESEGEAEKTPPAAPERQPWSEDLYKEDEEFKRWIERRDRLSHTRGQEQESGRRKELQQYMLGARQSFDSIGNALKEAIANGADAREIGQELAKNPDALQAYLSIQAFDATEIAEAQSLYSVLGAMGVIADVVKKPDLVGEFQYQLAREWRLTQDKGTATFRDFVTDAFKSYGKEQYDEGYKKGLNAGKGVAGEVAKGSERAGQRPAAVQGGTAAGVIRSMDDADREYNAGRLSHEAYKEAAKRFKVEL